MVSNDFINECKNPANCNRYGKLDIHDSNLILDQSNMIQDFSIDSSCYDDGNIIGTVYCKKLTANLIDAIDETLADKSFDAYVGLKYENNDTEYINLGKFTIEKPKDELLENFSSFTSYDDLMNKIDKKYVCSLDFDNNDYTLSDLYADVCIQLGLTPKSLVFDNSNIPIEDNPFTNGETNRAVLQSICKVSCSFVEIDLDDNEISLSWLSDSNEPEYVFEKSDYSQLSGGKVIYGPVNSLIIKSSAIDSENVSISDEPSILENGENQLVISDDYILYNETLRQQAITAIWNKVHNLSYVDCELTSYCGKPFLKIGSKIRIITGENEYIDTYVLQHIFTFDGAFTSVIKSPAMTKKEVETKQDISLGERLRRTEIIVNKQDGTITELVESSKKVDMTVNNNYQEIMQKFDGYAPKEKIVEIQSSVERIQTDTYTKTEINTKMVDGSVKKVQTVSGTFDENGMTYEKTNAQTKTTINEVGINTRRVSNNESILFAGYVDNNNTQYADYKGQTIVASENMLVKNYLVVGSHTRFENYENGTGVFVI